MGAAEVTAEQREADLWANEAARDALPRIRELAGQWAATVTALTGLFGVGTLISGDEVVRGLEAGWRVTYGLMSLMAVSLAAASILWASLAAQATVAKVGPGVASRVSERERRVDQARARLAWSRRLAGAALAALTLALAVRWYAPM